MFGLQRHLQQTLRLHPQFHQELLALLVSEREEYVPDAQLHLLCRPCKVFIAEPASQRERAGSVIEQYTLIHRF